MKKLMIAACAVAVAAAAQAYSIDWAIGTKSWKMADGDTLPNGQNVYLVNTSAASWSNWDGLGKTALMALAAGEITAANIASQGFYADTGTAYVPTTPGSNAHKQNYGKASGTGTTANLAEENYAILIWDTDSKSPDTYFIVSQELKGTSYDTNPDLGSKASFGANNFTAANSLSEGWAKVESVPEPTSGLLLLLGMAGLALRRRRA